MNSKATAVYAPLMLDPVREQLVQATTAILANVHENKADRALPGEDAAVSG